MWISIKGTLISWRKSTFFTFYMHFQFSLACYTAITVKWKHKVSQVRQCQAFERIDKVFNNIFTLQNERSLLL